MPKRPAADESREPGADVADEPEARVEAGVEHLQAAAHEMVAAARSFLDVVEDVVSDREKLGAVTASVTELLGSAGGGLARLAERFASGVNGAGASGDGAGGGAGDTPTGAPTQRPRLRRIEVE